MNTSNPSQRSRRRPRTLAALATALALATTIVLRAAPAPASPSGTFALPVRFYSQLDPAWGTLLIGYNYDVRMRSMGSLLTCMAMVASYYDVLALVAVPGTPPDGAPSPDYMHLWLATTGGYLRSGAKTVVVDYNLGFAFKDVAENPVGLAFRRFNGNQLDEIDLALDRGDPPIVYVQKTPGRYHSLVVVGFDEHTQSYLVLDPALPANDWIGSWPRPLRDVYGLGWAAMISGGLIPKVLLPDGPTPAPPTIPEYELFPLVDVSTKSPVELFAVDPDGRRAGWDPATESVLLDVPHATYLPQPVWSDPTGFLPDRGAGRLLSIPGAREGRYRYEMIATGDGPFTLNARVYDEGGARLVEESVVGTVSTGDVLKFQIEYSESGPSGFTVGDNFDPEANAGGARKTIVDRPVVLDGGASFDIDGTIVAYAWDLGDGASATGATPEHAYAASGTYTATLTVTDDKGATDTASAVVSVYEDEILDGTTERVSLSPWNTEAFGNFGSMLPAMSADGRFVAFLSFADNFGALADPSLFVRDRLMGSTEHVGAPDCIPRGRPAMTPDGRFVAYACSSNEELSNRKVLVTDRATGAHERVDVAPDGTLGACANTSYCASSQPAISDDGRFVAFVSDFENLVPGDSNGYQDVFVRDRATGTIERVSLTDGGAQSEYPVGSGGSRDRIAISGDGRFVAFASYATDLVPGMQVPWPRVYLRDRQLGRTELVSLPTDGVLGYYTGGVGPSMSADGRLVAFESNASDLVPGDTNGASDAFVRDRVAGTLERVNLSGAGAQATCPAFLSGACTHDPTISRDGRIVAFRSAATNLIVDDANQREDVFVRDRVAGTTQLVSRSTDGELGNDRSGPAGPFAGETVIALSGDGRFVAFSSDASNLVLDANGITDVFVRDRQASGLVADPSGPYVGWASAAGSPASVDFDASGSLHPTGLPLVASWSFGDGSPAVEVAATAPVSHAYAAPGAYTVTLVVSDGQRSSAPAVTSVEILPARAPSLTLTPACGSPGDPVQVTVGGHALVPPALGWDFADGTLPGVRSVHPEDEVRVRISGDGGSVVDEQLVPIDSFTTRSALEFATGFGVSVPDVAPGTHDVAVPDEAGVAGVTASLTVPCPALENAPPQASVGGPYAGGVGEPVAFDGRASSDPEGAPLTYGWLFEDGTTATGPQPAHSFAAPGTYWVLLVVNDGELDSPTSVGTGSFATVTISDTPPSGPCGELAEPASYASLGCRLTAARADTLSGVVAGRMRDRLVAVLGMASKRLAQSGALCATGKTRTSQARLRRVRPWLNGYERRLRSVQARALVPQAIRQSLLDAVSAVKADADVLRRGLACPADAGTP